MQNVASEMRAAGIAAPDRLIVDGAIHRFKNGGRSADGWYWLIEKRGKVYGAFGDWKLGVTGRVGEMTPEISTIVRERDEQREVDAFEAAAKALKIWTHCLPAGKSPYLARKNVGAYGIRFNVDQILVPMRDIEGTLWGVQHIDADGKKLFTKGCAKRGKFHLIGEVSYHKVIVICEGYATGATLHYSTLAPVAVAFDRTNLLPVARAIRDAHPDVKIVIAADHDHRTSCPIHKAEGIVMDPRRRRPSGCRCNPGLTDAIAAQRDVGGALMVPNVTHGTDFNDLAHELGHEAVFDAYAEVI